MSDENLDQPSPLKYVPTEATSTGPPLSELATPACSTLSLADALPKEIERCMELCEQYNALGPVGMFGYAMIRQDISAALKAMASGDVIAMLRAYETLKGCK